MSKESKGLVTGTSTGHGPKTPWFIEFSATQPFERGSVGKSSLGQLRAPVEVQRLEADR